MEIQINLPAVHHVNRAQHEVSIDLTKLSPEIVAELVMHGLTQKIGDAAAGKKGDEALASMQKVMDQLVAGEWTARRAGGGSGLSQVERMMVSKARGSLKSHVEGYSDMTTGERDAAIWELIGQLMDAQQDALRGAALRQIEMDKELGGLDLDI